MNLFFIREINEKSKITYLGNRKVLNEFVIWLFSSYINEYTLLKFWAFYTFGEYVFEIAKYEYDAKYAILKIAIQDRGFIQESLN